eukprot:scaffold86030_cov18-Prasinocladus_malaysianus.AAC.1
MAIVDMTAIAEAHDMHYLLVRMYQPWAANFMRYCVVHLRKQLHLYPVMHVASMYGLSNIIGQDLILAKSIAASHNLL